MNLKEIFKRFAPGFVLLAGSGIFLLVWSNTGRQPNSPLGKSTLAPVPTIQPPLALPTPARAAQREICAHPHRFICTPGTHFKDPTGDVLNDVEGEKRALAIFDQLTEEHPDWSPERVEDEAVRKIYDSKKSARIRQAFQYSLNTIKKILKQYPDTILSPREKRFLFTRLGKLKLEIPPPASVYADSPDLFTKNEIYFVQNSGETKIRVGGGFLFTARSWFNLVFSFSHEIGHAIDPCDIRSERPRIAIPAYDRLTSCFIRHQWVETRKTRSECVANDQVSEAFADWIASKVIAGVLKRYSLEFDIDTLIRAAANSVKDLCDQDPPDWEFDFSDHPEPRTRITSIFGMNPEIQEVLGCSSQKILSRYCELTDK